MRSQSVSVGGAGAGVAGGDGGLQEIGAGWGAGVVDAARARAVEAAADEELVPVGAVLIEEEDGFAGGGDAGAGAGGLDLHEGDEAVDFGLGGVSSARMRPRRRASSQRAGRIQSSPAVAE